MADNVGLHDLVGSVAGAIVDAQSVVERHYLDQVGRYFDAEGRPLSFALKLPSAAANASSAAYDEVCVPLLSLVESSMLAIAELHIELDVELGGITEPTGLSAQSAPMVSAPRDVPAIGPEAVADLGGPSQNPTQPAAAPPIQPATKVLAVAVGARSASGGPRARLSIKVESRPPSEGLLRLVTQLNKII